MEEIRSTEVLDREILEDARKKAMRILKAAEDTLEAQGRDWNKKLQDSLDSIRNVYAQKIKRSSDDILARLSLDRRRLRSEIYESFLVNAMNEFLGSLPREKLLSVMEEELSQRLKECAEDISDLSGKNDKAELIYSGISLSEARRIIKNVMPGLENSLSVSEAMEAQKFPSIVINTRALRISVSVEKSSGALMKEKRAELAAALIGGGALND